MNGNDLARARTISVVLPAFNEEGNVQAIHDAIRASLRGPEVVELVFVDDGSSDTTAERVRALGAGGSCVRLVRFGRNFGHQAALLAGLQTARGDAVITMDCDMQHPPELLPRMVEAWRGGAKVVQMVRRETVGATWFKRVTSTMFYRVMNFLSDSPVISGVADYQLLDRDVVTSVLRFQDRRPFLRGVVNWLGFPGTRIEYVAAARFAGTSAYSLRKMLKLSMEAITGLSSKPLRLSSYLGLVAAALCIAYMIYALVAMALGKTVQGWTSVIVTVLFLGAAQLVSVGILGEYVARIHEQTRGVPPFVIVESTDPPGEPE
jgi:dolichol-phosphate mannosyltransferase